MNSLHRQQGFTLVEVITVMLVLVAIASITVESSKDFVFQNHYEITKDRYEKIKKAIIGDPNQVINGQPNIEGFVKDMGRLPDNIRELFQTGYCRHTVTNTPITTKRRYYMCGGLGSQEEWIWVNTPCSKDNSVNQTKISCENDGGTWLGQKIDTGTTTNSGLYFGWKGSYLGTGKNAADNSAITDGWGNTETNEVDHPNYGWYMQYKKSDGTNINPVAGTTPITDAASINIQSKGKNGSIDTTDTGYDEDYPKATALPSIKQSDWTVDFNEIKVNVNTPYNGSCNISTCSDTTYADEVSCTKDNKIWDTNNTVCLTNATPSLNQSSCVSLGYIWNATITKCTDTRYTSENSCLANIRTWIINKNSKLNCEHGSGQWSSNSTDVHLKIKYRSIDDNGQTIIAETLSSSLPLNQDGREYQRTFNGFTPVPATGFPFGEVEVSLINNNTSSIYSGICKSSTTTELANCDTVGGTFDSTNKLCFNTTKTLCESHSGVLIFPEKQPIKLTLYPNTTLPTINW